MMIRSFLCAALTCAFTPLTGSAQNVASSKAQVLQAVVEQVIAPGCTNLATSSQAWAKAVEQFESKPDAAHLELARAGWLQVAQAAQRLDGCRLGPIEEHSRGAVMYFLPVRPQSVARAVAAMTLDGKLDFQQTGAAAKGLFAGEYLLYERKDALMSDARLRRYLCLVAQDVAGHACELTKAWQPPYRGAAGKFIEGGQDSLNQLVNRMVMTMEVIATRRIVLPGENGEAAKQDRVPGKLSGQEHALTQAAMAGLRQLHDAGLKPYVARLNPSLAERLSQQLAATLASIDALVQQRSPEHLMACCQQCQMLGVLLKVELPSTLGVTLTFISTDGD